ncbi:MAG: bifunctional precorrin-2 dehydrogenase/sirohydrochlorin ferrochelatase [Magnetococcales bacterium]|nr:bifunctional precorrin-2 dehydrogenase/sirohydrochlorin ferrochelatase [Magnetococcales bacterium]
MGHYFMEVDLGGRPVLVVGGGRVARRKLAGLLDCGAEITLVAPRLDPQVAARVAAGEVRHLPLPFHPRLLETDPLPQLVFAATDQAERNREIAALCRERRLWCNSADSPETSTFLVPALVRRGALTIAVGTTGQSPALARLVKERLDQWLEPGWEGLVALFGARRQEVRNTLVDPEVRHRFWRLAALEACRDGHHREPGDPSWFTDLLRRLATEHREPATSPSRTPEETE